MKRGGTRWSGSLESPTRVVTGVDLEDGTSDGFLIVVVDVEVAPWALGALLRRRRPADSMMVMMLGTDVIFARKFERTAEVYLFERE